MRPHDNDSILEYIKRSTMQSTEAKMAFYETHTQALIDGSKLIADTIVGGGKILIFGNGGSAADAQHMAAEMTGRMLFERKIHLPAIALTTDTSALTAIANDYSYEEIFEFQLKALGKKGDLAIAISTGGNSKNVIRAVEAGIKIGMKTISMTGGGGGKLKNLSDISLNVAKGLHASMIQETHITVVHLLVDLLDRFFLPGEYVTENNTEKSTEKKTEQKPEQ